MDTFAANDAPLDYRQQMPKITIPIYAISAKGDNFISPTRGCQLFLNPLKTLPIFFENTRSAMEIWTIIRTAAL